MSALPTVFVPFSESMHRSAVGSHIPIEVKEEHDSSAEEEGAAFEDQLYTVHGEQNERERVEDETSPAAHEIMDFSDEMIRVLLDLYKSHCSKMSNSRNNSEKAMWWEKMASEFNAKFNTSFSKKRLRTKVNNLKNKLRRFEDQHRISGHGQTTKIKMHKDLLDAFGNISGMCAEAAKLCVATDGEESDDRDGDCVQRDASKLHRNQSKIDSVLAGQVSCDDFGPKVSYHPQQEGENERRKRRQLKDLEEKELKRRRTEEDECRRVAGEEARKQEQQEAKESDEERRHREMMSVALGILTALNKIVEKL